MSLTSQQIKGNHAEEAACRYLQNLGMKLLTRNFRCRQGEIDLVMLEENTLVFVEVRYRKNDNYGSAIESITPIKQSKIRRTAEWYLMKHDPEERYCWRYDWVGVTPSFHSEGFKIEWIKNALEDDQ